jgi:hypothetical protein
MLITYDLAVNPLQNIRVCVLCTLCRSVEWSLYADAHDHFHRIDMTS